MLEPTKTVIVKPSRCRCGHSGFGDLVLFHTHQVMELPEICVEVTHFVFHKGRCLGWGTMNKLELPSEYVTGMARGSPHLLEGLQAPMATVAL